MVHDFCLGKEKESGEHSNSISLPLFFFFLAISFSDTSRRDEISSSCADLEEMRGIDISVLMDYEKHLGELQGFISVRLQGTE